MFALRAGDHVVQDSMDEVLGKADVGWLVMVTEDSVRPHHATMRVPGHAARDIDQDHRFEVIGAMDYALIDLD